SGHRDDEAWQLGLNAQQLAGSVRIPNAAQQPWLVQLNYLRLSDPAVAPMPEPDANRPSALAQFDPAQAIPIDVQIARLWRGDEDLGSISFQLRPIDHGLRLLNVSGTLRNVTLAQRDDRPTSLTWT